MEGTKISFQPTYSCQTTQTQGVIDKLQTKQCSHLSLKMYIYNQNKK